MTVNYDLYQQLKSKLHLSDTDAKELADAITNANSEEYKSNIKNDFERLEERINMKFENLEQRFTGLLQALDQKVSAQAEGLDKKFNTQMEALEHKIENKFKSHIYTVGLIQFLLIVGSIIGIMSFMLSHIKG